MKIRETRLDIKTVQVSKVYNDRIDVGTRTTKLYDFVYGRQHRISHSEEELDFIYKEVPTTLWDNFKALLNQKFNWLHLEVEYTKLSFPKVIKVENTFINVVPASLFNAEGKDSIILSNMGLHVDDWLLGEPPTDNELLQVKLDASTNAGLMQAIPLSTLLAEKFYYDC